MRGCKHWLQHAKSRDAQGVEQKAWFRLQEVHLSPTASSKPRLVTIARSSSCFYCWGSSPRVHEMSSAVENCQRQTGNHPARGHFSPLLSGKGPDIIVDTARRRKQGIYFVNCKITQPIQEETWRNHCGDLVTCVGWAFLKPTCLVQSRRRRVSKGPGADSFEKSTKRNNFLTFWALPLQHTPTTAQRTKNKQSCT